VLLTGAGGLLGSAIQRVASKFADLEIVLVTRKDVDLLDLAAVREFYATCLPIDTVIHCAAVCSGLEANIASPTSLLYDNIVIDRNTIVTADSFNISNLLYMNSSSIYPFGIYDKAMKEKDLLTGPPSPENYGYAYAKIIGGEVCRQITNSSRGTRYYKSIVIASLYGPCHKYEGTDAHFVVAPITKIRQAMESGSGSVGIWGDGSNRRELVYVDDFAEYLLYLCSSHLVEIIPQYLNVGINKDYSVTDYYEAVAKVFGYTGNFIYDTTKPSGCKHRLLDSTLALERYQWFPKTSLNEGINKIYSYGLGKGR
jgi:GDP-L-fucose synthase